MKAAVGQLGHAFRLPGDPDVVLDDVVVGLEILVAERPVIAVPVVGPGLQVEIAQPITLPAPHVGAAADHAHPSKPAEWLVCRGGVGLVQIVREPVIVVFHAGVAVFLHGTRFPDQLVRPVAILQLEGAHVLRVGGISQGASTVHERHLDPRFGQPLGSPAAGGAGADDDDVEGATGRDDLHLRTLACSFLERFMHKHTTRFVILCPCMA